MHGKLTYVHRDLWPALGRLADELGQDRLARIRDVHTDEGKHSVEETPFSDWVSTELRTKAAQLSTADARRILAAILPED